MVDSHGGPGEQIREMLRGCFVLAVVGGGGQELAVDAFVCAGFVRPDEPDKIVATGSEPLDEYQRKTQSPIIWVRACFAAGARAVLL